MSAAPIYEAAFKQLFTHSHHKLNKICMIMSYMIYVLYIYKHLQNHKLRQDHTFFLID